MLKEGKQGREWEGRGAREGRQEGVGVKGGCVDDMLGVQVKANLQEYL